MLIDRKQQGQICSFEIRGRGNRINCYLILDDIRMHLFIAGQKKKQQNKPDEWQRGTKQESQ